MKNGTPDFKFPQIINKIGVLDGNLPVDTPGLHNSVSDK